VFAALTRVLRRREKGGGPRIDVHSNGLVKEGYAYRSSYVVCFVAYKLMFSKSQNLLHSVR
jgi:hypothetical protein